jgi:Ras-related GTP-binding protein A/B
LRENSDDANVWVLINKMDLVSRDQSERGRVFEEKRAELEKRSNAVQVDGKEAKPIRCFATSIYDESLYKVLRGFLHQ